MPEDRPEKNCPQPENNEHRIKYFSKIIIFGVQVDRFIFDLRDNQASAEIE